jgi:tRNA threonylcarbamoyladenosine biosynthesis protein TsaB
VALLRGEQLVGEEQAGEGRSGAEGLLPALEGLLARAQLAAADLDAFAVSIGPGSFTGLRVGVATLKGLAFGADRPVAAVPTLAALACSAPAGEGPVVAMLDARRGEVYAASWRVPGPAREPEPAGLPEGVYGVEELARSLPRRCRLVGDGVAVCGEALRAALGAGVLLHPPPHGRPRARDVGWLGARRLARGQAVVAADLVPRYLRRAAAEAKRTGQRLEPA